jgi:hypothetical protein
VNKLEQLIDSLRYRPVATTAAQMYEAALWLDCMFKYIKDMAGRDCARYTKHLSERPCGNCDSCMAREVLALAGD